MKAIKKLSVLVTVLIIGFANKSLAQCDATFVPSHLNPVTGIPVHFLYWGDIAYDPTWSYTINYGNGSTAGPTTGALTDNIFGSQTYSTAGVYTVSVTVIKSSPACTASYSYPITVATAGCAPSSPSLFDDPVVSQDVYQIESCAGEEKTFTVDYNGSGTLGYVVWNMGDGSILYTVTNTVNYTYADGGVYFVTAKVVETGGCYDYAKVLLSASSSDYAYYYQVFVADGDPSISMTPASPMVGDPVTFTYSGDFSLFPPDYLNCWRYSFKIDNGSYSVPATLTNGGTLGSIGSVTAGCHTAILDIIGDGSCSPGCEFIDSISFCVGVDDESCDTCNSFKPQPGEYYWLSAWVQEDNGTTQLSTYNDVSITLRFITTSGTSTINLTPTGEIIDGWQRIAGKFQIPSNTLDLEIVLNAGNLITYFDDIRVHPFNGSMKSYVYDGETFWLVAELDDNNYATIYEYDAEGGLIRIKKETSGGIVTIQETRSSTIKVTP